MHRSGVIFRPLVAALCLSALATAPTALAQPSTQFGDNFNGYPAGVTTPNGFLKGGTTNATWALTAPGVDSTYRNNITLPSGIGGGISYAVRGVPYVGGVHRKNFTMSSSFVLASGVSGFTIGMIALAPAHPYNTTNGPFYWFTLDANGTIKIRTGWDTTTGLTLGTATNLPGPLQYGVTYNFTVTGTYTGTSLALNFTVTSHEGNASITATAANPLTGPNFGFQNRTGPAGSNLMVDVNNFNVSVPRTFTQVWADEFNNGSTLNTAVWSKGYRWSDVINNELQAHRPENVVVGNGVCTINVTNPSAPVKNRDMNGYEWGAFDYASGAIQTYNKWTRTYGYFEARIKMPAGKGTWPAFWLLPDRGASVTPLTRRVEVGDNGFGRGTELDIVEYMAAWKNSSGLSKSHSGLIWSYASGGGTASSDYALTGDGFGPTLWYANADSGFHTYGMNWEPGVVTFYLDGKVVLTRQNATYVPNCPHYIILNTAITQNDWHGNTIPIADINAGMPSKMEIDYVRVFNVTP